jgi:glyoxylase-like metal-dependent hydrolase (beta-lactamase superfamily II)
MTFEVGDIRVDALYDGVARVSASVLYPNASRDTLARAFPDGAVEFYLGGFLVRTPQRTVIVDTGAGPITRDLFSGGAFLDSLAAFDVGPEDVDEVVLTHLHWDHVGWTAQKGAIVFPNAAYRCHQADWDHFICDEGAARKLNAFRDRLEPWKDDGPLMPGIDTMHAPGHTPGSTVLVLSSGAERALILGDAAHCPLELEETTLDGFGDVDVELAKRTREAIARELETDGVMAAGSHFPGLRFGRLLAAEGVRRWVV